MLAVAVAAAFALSTVAPAVAAPDRNPTAVTFTVTCGNDTWNVITNWMVGWPVDGSAGTTPGRLFGGTVTRTFDDGQVVTQTYAPPAGLVPMLQTCRMEGPLESVGFYSVWDPAYILFPGG